MRICIPIRSKNLAEAKKQVDHALREGRDCQEGVCDDLMLEIWLDSLKKGDSGWISEIPAPVVAVCRGEAEKGDFAGKEGDRVDMLKAAVSGGAKFVDIGIQTEKSLISDLKKHCKKHGANLIISRHFWEKTPDKEELMVIIERAKSLGADIVKIATNVKNWSDNVILFEVASVATKMGVKVIVVGMGERGRISRLGCPLLGSFLTYVALDEKSATASGQMTLQEFKKFTYASPDWNCGTAECR